MPSAPPIAAIIYDCDGTLVDSELLNARCMTDMLERDQGLTLDPVAVEKEFRGGKFHDMCLTLAARHGVTLAADFTARYREYAEGVFERELVAMPGVREAIEAIGSPRCVASSGPPGKLATALRVTDLARYFGDLVFSAYEIKAWKPEPDLFLHAACKMNVDPAACAVIEDSDAGVEAGRRADMRVFGYDRAQTIGAHPNAALTRFTDFAELPRLVRLSTARTG